VDLYLLFGNPTAPISPSTSAAKWWLCPRYCTIIWRRVRR